MNQLHDNLGRLMVAFIAAVSIQPISAATWPGFRGAAGTGVSDESELPTQWSLDKNLAWSVTLPGRGNSSPVVTSDRVYLSTHTPDLGLWVLAIEKASGELIWKEKMNSGQLAAKGPENLWAHRHNPATSTLAADESHVWAFFGTGQLYCLNKRGDIQWQRDLVKDYGEYDITFGMGSSPRLWKGRLYINCITKGPSYVVALDAKTGETIWKRDRDLPAEADGADAYSTPVVWEGSGKEELLVAGSDHINAYDLRSGKQLWIAGGFKIKSPYGRIIASPAVSQDVIIQCAGNPGGGGLGRAIALKAGERGEISETGRLWTIERTAPDASTPVCYGDLAFLVRANGITLCVDLKTGEVFWEERMAQGEYFCAAVAGDQKVYLLGTTGICTVVDASKTFRKLGENKLPGTFYSSPAISDGMLFLRSENTLYAVR